MQDNAVEWQWLKRYVAFPKKPGKQEDSREECMRFGKRKRQKKNPSNLECCIV